MVRDGMGVKLSDFRITGNDIRIKSITIVVGLAGLKLVIAISFWAKISRCQISSKFAVSRKILKLGFQK